jgi:hypothetical protein
LQITTKETPGKEDNIIMDPGELGCELDRSDFG